MAQIRHVTLPWRNDNYIATVFENLFTAEECQELIAQSERQGYGEALVNVGGGRQKKIDGMRNNDRCIIDDPTIAALIWKRVQDASAELSQERLEEFGLDRILKQYKKYKDDWYPVGLNERLRFLRYKPNTFFRPHYDGSYMRQGEAGDARRGEASLATLQLYLNQNFQEGETKFLSDFDESVKVRVPPKLGSVLIFQHDLLHEGAPVAAGRKYVIRTDVMYTKKGPGHEYVNNPIVLKSNTSDSFEAMDVAD